MASRDAETGPSTSGLFAARGGFARTDPAGPRSLGWSLQLATYSFAALVLLSLAGPYMTMVGSGSLTGEGNSVRQAGYLIFLVLAAISTQPWRHPERLVAIPLFVAAVVAWCWLSIAWSAVPGIAFRRVLLMTMVLWSLFLLVRELGYERTIAVMRVTLVAALIANYVAVFLFPDFGVHQRSEPYDKALTGDWRGVMLHKNIAGLTSALTVLIFLFESGKLKLAVRAPILALALLFLFFSGSRTSLGVCVIAAIVGYIYFLYRGQYRGVLMGVGIVAALVVAAYFNTFNDPLLRNLDDPTALTGRVTIWNALVSYFQDSPLLGAGYGSFWNVGAESPIYRYQNNWVVDLAQGHNGYLDLLVTIGLPGLLLALAAVLIEPLYRLFTTRATEGPRGALALSLLVFCLAHNFTESSLFDRDTIGEVFLLAAIAIIHLLATPAKPPRLNRNSPERTPRPQNVAGRRR